MRTSVEPLSRPTLALWGFMGTGKSVVGRALASRCGAAFVDLDLAIEEASGRSVTEIFASDGELRFRQIEGEILDGLLAETDERPRVIALGGGALLDAERRERALARWLVVVLACSAATIVARTRKSTRPLLAAARDEGARSRLVAHLLKRRAPAYAAAHVTLSCDTVAATDLAEELASRWKRRD